MAVLAATLTAPASALAVGPAIRATRVAAKPFYDIRVAERATANRPPGVSSRERAARTQLRDRLGAQGVVQVDPLTGTARNVQRLNGTLTGVAGGDRAAVARRWMHDNRAALGLTEADVDALTLADRSVARGSGITHLLFRQSYGGIPTFDSGVRVNLDRGGRILNVTGAPVSGLQVASTTPQLGAVDALRALQRNVGVRRAVAVAAGPSGARDTTRFKGGDEAELVLFGDRLAWHLTYRATSLAHYDAVVDATSGRVLYRQNLTKFAVNASVFPDYPQPSATPVQTTVDIEPFLTTANTLEGHWVHAYADVDDDSFTAGDDIPRTGGNDYAYAFTPFQRPAAAWHNACDHVDPSPAGRPNPLLTQATCAWNPTSSTSWQTNRNQNGVQAFYLANTFRDHLNSGPIGFNGFEDADKVDVETDDGADIQDSDHLNNANMSTLPEGQSPTMQMYLFEYDISQPSPQANLRNINGGDTAAILWHEYTHGLSNRLITDDDGFGALGSAHAGAMGEGWSDWYAMDFIDRQNLEADTAAPDVSVGLYADAEFGSVRSEPIDCLVGSTDANCPGGFDTGQGGYTLGDFGKVLGVPEVHADGEIWAQTLWDLRSRLITALGSEAAGSDLAEQLITDGMRMSPPEPSFLDARNGILAAVAADAPAQRDLVWSAFATRGMGFYAGAADSSDVQPLEDFHMPPAANAAKGRVAGTVTSADTGFPIGGASVGFGGLTTDAPFPDRVAPTTTAANGTYSLLAPPGAYRELVYRGAAGFDRVKVPTTVTSGTTRTQNVALRRDWAAFAGGGETATSDNSGAPFGCGADALIDQSQGFGWSAVNPHGAGTPTVTVRLRQTIDITKFGLDPGNICGDDPTSATRGFTIDTSADGAHFARAVTGTFTDGSAGTLHEVTPTANKTGVRFVRLSLLSPQHLTGSGNDFIDFAELEVFGGPRNVLPRGALSANLTRVSPGATVTFGAAFSDPDSKITGYTWDFDGNGTVDRTTSTPTTTFAYAASGDFTARVSAKDFRGGAGAASLRIHVTTAPIVGALPRTGRKSAAKFPVSCDTTCSATATLKISKKLAKQLGLKKKRTVGSLKRTLGPGAHTLTIKLTSKVKRALKRHHRKSLKATLTVTVRYPDGRSASRHRAVKIKR